MSTSNEFAQHIAELVENAGNIRYRKMFGEFALYCDEKVVAFLCDDQLFVKPTPEGQAFADNNGLPTMPAPPYPGAKDYMLVEAEDRDLVTDLIRLTAEVLPLPKNRKRKKQ